MKFSTFSLSTLTAVVAIAGSSNTFITTIDAQTDNDRNDNDIPTTAVTAGIFNTLVAALSATDLVGAISSPAGPFTVFAPTDDAFDLLPDGLVGCLLEEDNLPILSDILLYHVASGEVLSTGLTNGMNIPTLLQGQNVIVDLSNGGVKINDSTVTTPDVLATNGVIHIINQVLVPPSVDVAAFLTTCGSGSSSSLVDIPTTAINAEIFTTLVAALSATDLVAAISTPNGPYTVFAPTDDAFASLPNGLVPCLLEEDNLPILSDILLYHVASGQVLSTALTNGMNIPTLLQGQNVIVDLSNGGVKINDSTVTTPDVLATNGVIHIINQVLVPPSVDVAAFLTTCGGGGGGGGGSSSSLVDIPTTAINAGIFSTLVAALSATDLVGALSSPNGPYTVFAPTDDAFASLPNGLVPCLLQEDNLPVLSNILLYHVASGEVLSTDLTEGMNIPTLLQRQSVIVDLSNGGVKINDSTVTAPDVLASNGVIHIIDQVLVPPSIDVAGFLATCGEPIVVSKDCVYSGVWRSANQWLTGPTHTCLCTHGGHWLNCRLNTPSDTDATTTTSNLNNFDKSNTDNDTAAAASVTITGSTTTSADSNSNQSVEQFGVLESDTSTSISSGTADSTNKSTYGQFGVVESDTSSLSSSSSSFSFCISFVSTVITLVVLY